MPNPDYTIDLCQPPTQRWAAVAKKDKPALKKLVGTIKGFVLSIPKPVFRIISAFYWPRNAMYLREANAFADVLGESRALIQAAQLMYELVHLVDKNSFKDAPRVGCTTTVGGDPLTLMRTLDWNLPGMANNTRIFEFINGKAGTYTGVGTVGAVSVLTALHEKGRYCIAMNDAPPVHGLRSGVAPSFQIRRAMESCTNYGAAVGYLTKPKLATAAFFVVVNPDGAAHIEHTGRIVRTRESDFLSMTNHYQLFTSKELGLTPDGDSVLRRDAGLVALRSHDRKASYRAAPINTDITQYRALCVPEKGVLELF